MKKNHKFITISLGVILIMALITGFYAMAGNSDSVFLKKWGQILSTNSSSDNSQIYAKGKNTTVFDADIEQARQFFALSGMDEKSAEEQAVEYTLEREALYHAAIENGYSVTDQEVREYLEELKVTLNSADNKEVFLDILSQFDSEEDYWEFQFSVYQKDLPIQHYVRDLEQQYMEAQIYSENGDKTNNDWEAYFEQFKDDLRVNEKYKVMN